MQGFHTFTKNPFHVRRYVFQKRLDLSWSSLAMSENIAVSPAKPAYNACFGGMCVSKMSGQDAVFRVTGVHVQASQIGLC